MLDRLLSTVFDATEPLRLHGVIVCSNPILCSPIGEGLEPHPFTFFPCFALLLPLPQAFVKELFLPPIAFPKLFHLLILLFPILFFPILFLILFLNRNTGIIVADVSKPIITPWRVSADVSGIWVVITIVFAHGCAGIWKWFCDGIGMWCFAVPLC